jgi:hypothetical protein
MKITVIVTILIFLLSSNPVLAQISTSFIDEFFHSLPTKVYYWKIWETSYESFRFTSFNAVVLKLPGLPNKYLFQESDILVIVKATKDTKKDLYSYYYYFPDENEQDMNVEIFLPGSRAINYTDTQYPRVAKGKELDDIELKIGQFSNVLHQYNTLYVADVDYSQNENITATLLGLGFGIPLILTGPQQDTDLQKVGYTLGGVLFVAIGIRFGGAIIGDALKVKPRRTELKKLESTLRDIVNMN